MYCSFQIYALLCIREDGLGNTSREAVANAFEQKGLIRVDLRLEAI